MTESSSFLLHKHARDTYLDSGRAALHFARSLNESQLEIARGVYRYPHASVEEFIREELSRLDAFDFRKQTMIAFFRDQIPTTDLQLDVLRNTPVAAQTQGRGA